MPPLCGDSGSQVWFPRLVTAASPKSLLEIKIRNFGAGAQQSMFEQALQEIPIHIKGVFGNWNF